MANLKDVKPGDKVKRMLAGTIPMILEVHSVDSTLITCHGGWTFCPETGMEIDPDLSWGPGWGYTGSYLVKE